jgi:hypothetical protein
VFDELSELIQRELTTTRPTNYAVHGRGISTEGSRRVLANRRVLFVLFTAFGFFEVCLLVFILDVALFFVFKVLFFVFDLFVFVLICGSLSEKKGKCLV